jgi:hypothetical protein
MRTTAALSLSILLLALLAAPADAGEARIVGVDRYAAPGETMWTSVELTNDSEKPARFKIVARVRGDKEKATGKARRAKGKRARLKVRLEPGESTVKSLELSVPKKADGPIVLECKVRWKKGKEKFVESGLALHDGEDGGGNGGELPDDAIEVEGTLTLEIFDMPPDGEKPDRPDGEKPDRPDGEKPDPNGERPDGTYRKDENAIPGIWMPWELAITSDDGERWTLFGHEAEVLAKLMYEADLVRTRAAVVGVPMDVLPAGDEPPREPGPDGGKRLHEEERRPELNSLWVLEWVAVGIEDPRDKYVPHRYVLDGFLSKFEEPRELVIQTQDDWERLLDAAGIVLPEVPEPWWPDDPEFPDIPGIFKGEHGHGGDNGHGEGDRGEGGHGQKPPDVPEFWAPWDVNFEKETVVAVFAGEQPTTGHWVVIPRIVKDGEIVVVQHMLFEPWEHEVVIEVPTQPFAIAAIPKTDARIVFDQVAPGEGNGEGDPTFPR